MQDLAHLACSQNQPYNKANYMLHNSKGNTKQYNSCSNNVADYKKKCETNCIILRFDMFKLFVERGSLPFNVEGLFDLELKLSGIVFC